MLAFTAFMLGVIIIFAINPVTSVMIKYYEKTKSDYSKDIDHLVSINKNGLWIKEMYDDNLRITTAKTFESPFMNNVTIYEIGQDNKIIRRIESEQVASGATKSQCMLEVDSFRMRDRFVLSLNARRMLSNKGVSLQPITCWGGGFGCRFPYRPPEVGGQQSISQPKVNQKSTKSQPVNQKSTKSQPKVNHSTNTHLGGGFLQQIPV